ncbi:MAG TPA: imidazoleglycerol-phosphate dehydratase HisB, partial [Wenzhouxiangella sp.]|nr:imidazoleglycerol-phosphate dehydratase HisB [Wenzhouxiangella sp.]
RVERHTSETALRVEVDLDRADQADIDTGIGFFDHMLAQIARHGGIGIQLQCRGDLEVDDHHSVEDCGLALGEALRTALGDRRGIARYGATLPMDDALADAAIDLSGRPWLEFDGRFPRDRVGQMSTEMVPHFFDSLCQGLGANLHLSVRGDNAHHMVEACFKAVARCLRQAVRREHDRIPSTKGVLA